MIKTQLIELIERTFKYEDDRFVLTCTAEQAFFTSEEHKNRINLPLKKYLKQGLILKTMFYIRVCSKLYRQNEIIPMGTNCAPLVADMFLIFSERGFMRSLAKEKWNSMIEVFNSIFRYLVDLLNIVDKLAMNR